MADNYALKAVFMADLASAPFIHVPHVAGQGNNRFTASFPRYNGPLMATRQSGARSYGPQLGEASYSLEAISRIVYLKGTDATTQDYRDALERQLAAHPEASWSNNTRMSLTSGQLSDVDDPVAILRGIPAATQYDDLETVLTLTTKAVEATNECDDTLVAAKAVATAIFMARNGHSEKAIFDTIRKEYGIREMDAPETVLKAAVNDNPTSKHIVGAALRIASMEGSFEDALRRGVVLGGKDSVLVCALAGAVKGVYQEYVELDDNAEFYSLVPSSMLDLIDHGYQYKEEEKAYQQVNEADKAANLKAYLELEARFDHIRAVLLEAGLTDEKVMGVEQSEDRAADVDKVQSSETPSVSYYSGKIEPGENIVFVFGSNPEGRHGAGAAKIAKTNFGAVTGVGEGLQGNSYALPTKDLRVTENNGYRSIPVPEIIKNIQRMYEVAAKNPDKNFMVAYTNTPGRRTQNGYTGAEMIQMFVEAGFPGNGIPSNVQFSENWKKEMDIRVSRKAVALKRAYSSLRESMKKETAIQLPDAYWPDKPEPNVKRRSFSKGGLAAGSFYLNDMGLLVVENGGDYRDIGIDADISEYKNAAWCERTIFSRWDVADPLKRVSEMKQSMGVFVLDEGRGVQKDDEGRYMEDDKAIPISEESNLDALGVEGIVEAEERVNIREARLAAKGKEAVALKKEVPKIIITESMETGYRERTRRNAMKGTLTVAFAYDYNTSGEALTAAAAGSTDPAACTYIDKNGIERTYTRNSGLDRYVRLDPKAPVEDNVKIFHEALRRGFDPKNLVINIAGNSMATIAKASEDTTQEDVNCIVVENMKAISESVTTKRENVRIKGVLSGGQTGFDEAAIAVSKELGIPCELHFPKNYRWRDAQGKDHEGAKALNERFKDYDIMKVEETEREQLELPMENKGTVYLMAKPNSYAELEATCRTLNIMEVTWAGNVKKGSRTEKQLEEFEKSLGEIGVDCSIAASFSGDTGDWDEKRVSEGFVTSIESFKGDIEKGHSFLIISDNIIGRDENENYRVGLVGKAFLDEGVDVRVKTRNGAVMPVEEVFDSLCDKYEAKGLIKNEGLKKERHESMLREMNKMVRHISYSKTNKKK